MAGVPQEVVRRAGVRAADLLGAPLWLRALVRAGSRTHASAAAAVRCHMHVSRRVGPPFAGDFGGVFEAAAEALAPEEQAAFAAAAGGSDWDAVVGAWKALQHLY